MVSTKWLILFVVSYLSSYFGMVSSVKELDDVCDYLGGTDDCSVQDAQCDVCSNGNTLCSACKNGFFRKSDELDQCVRCSLIPKCNDCSDYQGCIACNDGSNPILNSCGVSVCRLGPSESPTYNPTNSPTVYPSGEPSKSPSEDPTSYPTRNPTKSPNAEPTAAPSVAPTLAPSYSPTSDPTQEPLSEEEQVDRASNLGDCFRGKARNLTTDEIIGLLPPKGMEVCVNEIGCSDLDIPVAVNFLNPCDIEYTELNQVIVGDERTNSLLYKFCGYCRDSRHGFFWMNGYRYIKFDRENHIIRYVSHFKNENGALFWREQYNQVTSLYPDSSLFPPIYYPQLRDDNNTGITLESQFDRYIVLLNNGDNGDNGGISYDSVFNVNDENFEICYNSVDCGGIELFLYQLYLPLCDLQESRIIEDYSIDYDSFTVLYQFCGMCADNETGSYWFNGIGYIKYDENGLITRLTEHWDDDNSVQWFTQQIEIAKNMFHSFL